MTTLRDTIARALAHHREARGWTQRQLAEEARLSLDTVTKCEASSTTLRARAPSVDVLERLAAALEISPAALVVDPSEGADLAARALVQSVGLPEALRRLADAS